MSKVKKQKKENSDSVEQVKKETRLRVWCGIFYPESTKSNWKDILEKNMIPCAVSPLHDHDPKEPGEKYDYEGDYKKAHYHIVFRFAGSKSFNQVWDILKLIANDPDHCPPPEKPHSDIERLVQYLVHANDKNKHTYQRIDITPIAGFDVDRYFRLNSEEEDEVFCFILDFIQTRKIKELWDLFECLRACRYDDPIFDDAFRYAHSHYFIVSGVINSFRNKNKKNKNEEDENE